VYELWASWKVVGGINCVKQTMNAYGFEMVNDLQHYTLSNSY